MDLNNGYDHSEKKILVIEDNKLNRMLIEKYLLSGGYRNVNYAEDGEQGLEQIYLIQPDIIILDLMMPKIDGFEVCRTMRQKKHLEDIPILVLTGLDTSSDRSRAYDVGATDVVSKPISGPELLARVKIHLDNQALLQDLQTFYERLADELVVVKRLQNDLLPSEKKFTRLKEKYGINISSHFRPSHEIGGDFWTIIPIDKHKLGLFMCDLTGHGVVAAVNTFRVHTLLNILRQDGDLSPSNLFYTLNQELNRLLAVGQFAAAFYGVIDTKKHEMTYVSAAWEQAMIFDPETRDTTMLEGRGLPLGIMKNAEHTETTVALPQNAVIMSYSDALVEQQYGSGETISTDQLTQFIQSANDLNLSITDYILDCLSEMGLTHFEDDLTIVTLQIDNQDKSNKPEAGD